MNPASPEVEFLINQLTHDDKYSNIFALMVRAQIKMYQIMNYPEGNYVIRGTQRFTAAQWAARVVASGLAMLDRDTSEVVTYHGEVVIDDNNVIGDANAKIVALEQNIALGNVRNENSPPRQIRRTGTHTRRAVTPPRIMGEVNEIINSLNAEIAHFNNNNINHRPPQQGGRKNKTIKKNNKKAKKTRNNRK
jgi:hypothetical protein